MAGSAIRGPADSGPRLIPGERQAWQQALRPLLGASWLDLPWYQGRGLLLPAGAYRHGVLRSSRPRYGRDPFAAAKATELRRSGPPLAAALAGATLPVLLRSALWGNRVDLSNYEIDRGGAGTVLAAAGELVIDHAAAAEQRLRTARRLDLVADNAGARAGVRSGAGGPPACRPRTPGSGSTSRTPRSSSPMPPPPTCTPP